MHLFKNKTDCICIHPQHPRKTKSAPIIKYRKNEQQNKNQRRKKIIKINKYSLVYIVKCAFILSNLFSHQARIKIWLNPAWKRSNFLVIKRFIYLAPSTLNNRLIPRTCEQPPVSGLGTSGSHQPFLYWLQRLEGLADRELKRHGGVLKKEKKKNIHYP